MGMSWCKRGEAVEKGGWGGGGGGGVLFESRPWYGKLKLGEVLSIQVNLQMTSRVRLVVLYYINFTMGADLTISVRYGYNSVESGRSPHTCISKARKLKCI